MKIFRSDRHLKWWADGRDFEKWRHFKWRSLLERVTVTSSIDEQMVEASNTYQEIEKGFFNWKIYLPTSILWAKIHFTIWFFSQFHISFSAFFKGIIFCIQIHRIFCQMLCLVEKYFKRLYKKKAYKKKFLYFKRFTLTVITIFMYYIAYFWFVT